MKKLVFILLATTLFVSCSKTNMEDDYETSIQVIDKEHARRPGTQGATD